jgi:hypothetical protein
VSTILPNLAAAVRDFSLSQDAAGRNVLNVQPQQVFSDLQRHASLLARPVIDAALQAEKQEVARQVSAYCCPLVTCVGQRPLLLVPATRWQCKTVAPHQP